VAAHLALVFATLLRLPYRPVVDGVFVALSGFFPAELWPVIHQIDKRPQRRRRYRRFGGRVLSEAVPAGAIRRLRLSLACGHISVDSLASQLVVGRCLAHGAQP
jgi:hypothetical protein